MTLMEQPGRLIARGRFIMGFRLAEGRLLAFIGSANRIPRKYSTGLPCQIGLDHLKGHLLEHFEFSKL